jgi:shikimate dehydrogenase
VTTTIRAACVIGWPVEHSRSPLIHNYWLNRYGIAGEYRRELVPPEEFALFVGSLAARGYVGANVTLPHKEAALALSEPDERARAVGAANTLWLDGVLRATNTDVEGFLDNLDACAPHWDRSLKKAVVLGAGGAARAVIYGLIARGVEQLVLVNRTLRRA